MKIVKEPYHTRDESGKWTSREIDTLEWLAMVRAQAVEYFGEEVGNLYDRLAARCEEFVCGRNRAAFIFSNYVIKLPMCPAGCGDNDWEGSISTGDNPNDIQYARTRLLYWKNKIPIVLMERVEHARSADIIAKLGEEPDWCMSVDCGQVGWNRAGKLVAYDYGMN